MSTDNENEAVIGYYSKCEILSCAGCCEAKILELNRCEEVASYRNLEIEKCNVELVTQGQYSYAS
jgi:hypothetical protein